MARVCVNVRAASLCAAESQEEVGSKAIGPTSAEIDAQHFFVLSALTDGERFDIVTFSGSDHGSENWRRWDPHTAGGTRILLEDISHRNAQSCHN